MRIGRGNLLTRREPAAARAVRNELLDLLRNACMTVVVDEDHVALNKMIVRSWVSDCGHWAVREVGLTAPVDSDDFAVDQGTLIVGDVHSAYSILVGSDAYYRREKPFCNQFPYHDDSITGFVLESFRAHIGGESPSRATCPALPELDLTQSEVYAL